MSAIGPGDFVESLDTASDGTDSIVAGQIYQIARVYETQPPWVCCYCGKAECTSVNLVSDVCQSEDAGWCLTAFRPVYRPRADLIESLKQPAIPDQVATEVSRVGAL